MNKKSNKEFYEKLSGKKLTDKEVSESKSNFVGFFDLLLKIDERNKGGEIERFIDKNRV